MPRISQNEPEEENASKLRKDACPKNEDICKMIAVMISHEDWG